MSVPRFWQSAAVLACGYTLAALLFWALLNVPESTVMSLVLSVLLLVAATLCVGITTGLTLALSQHLTLSASLRRAIAALPGFLLGLLVCGLLWWATARFDLWWMRTRGEVDALVLRYLGTARTEPLHVAVPFLSWTVRWVLGLSVVAALTSAALSDDGRSIGRGLRLAIRPRLLAAALLALLVGGEGLRRLAYWRPSGLPASSVEIAFAILKLGVLYAAAIGMATIVLQLYSGQAERTRHRPT